MAITKFRGDNAFLSNMYPVGIIINGEFYPSAEHAFQAMKSLDKAERVAISVRQSPEDAKRAGKLVQLRPDWEEVKVGIMKDILKVKFSDSDLAAKLKDTGHEELIEVNTWHDTFWGVCNDEGSNMLGKLLMEIREEMQS